MQENIQKNGQRGYNGRRCRRGLWKASLGIQGFLWTAAACLASGHVAYASDASGIITAQFNILLNIVTSIISSIGTIITLWGISEWGIAFQSQDGTSQAHAFKRIAGGLVMLLAPQLINLF